MRDHDDDKVVDLGKRRRTKNDRAKAKTPAAQPNPLEVKPTIEVAKVDLKKRVRRPSALVPDEDTLEGVRRGAAGSPREPGYQFAIL